jgi:MFS family permease
MKRYTTFAVLASLYIAQGLPFGFFTQAMPALLRQQGMDLSIIGLSSLLALPWALKFAWAPWVDRTTLWGKDRRRSWIISMNVGAVGCLIFISFWPLSWLASNGISLLFIILFFINLCSATQDIATDGMAVENLSFKSRGLGNGIQVAGYRIGMVIGGGVLLYFLSDIGWQYAMWILAGLLLLSCLPIALFKPKPIIIESREPIFKQWLTFIKQPGMGWWIALLLLYKAGDSFGTVMIKPMLVDQGISIENIALMVGSAGFTIGLVGALLGGWLVPILGRAWALGLFAGLQVFAIGAYAWVPMFDLTGVELYALVMLEHLSGGMGTAALFTIMMDKCRTGLSATDYSLQASLQVMAAVLAAALSGFSAHLLGYEGHFLLAAGISSLAVLLVMINARWIMEK